GPRLRVRRRLVAGRGAAPEARGPSPLLGGSIVPGLGRTSRPACRGRSGTFACMVGAGGYDVAAVTKASSGGNPASRTPPARSTPNGRAAPRPKRQARAQTPRPPETPGIARIIAIANQKGGVGKSTTAVSLGAALAHIGYRVLVVDLDPQGNASTGMGIRHEARDYTVYDVIVAEAPVTDAVVATPVERLFAIPSTIDLAR